MSVTIIVDVCAYVSLYIHGNQTLVHSHIALPYNEHERWLFDRLHGAAIGAAEQADFVVQDIELTQETWKPVKHYLDRMEDDEPPAFSYDRIERLYDALDVESMTFDQLASAIGKELLQSSMRTERPSRW